jgi:hypothetical protein
MDEELTGKKKCKEREKEQGGWITQNYVRRRGWNRRINIIDSNGRHILVPSPTTRNSNSEEEKSNKLKKKKSKIREKETN